jgi:hypothetical protein
MIVYTAFLQSSHDVVLLTLSRQVTTLLPVPYVCSIGQQSREAWDLWHRSPVAGHIGAALGREDRPHPHPHPGEIYRFRSLRLMFSENKLLLSCPTASSLLICSSVTFSYNEIQTVKKEI